jgi:hypothetical protein
MKEPIFVTGKKIRAIHYNGDNIAEIQQFLEGSNASNANAYIIYASDFKEDNIWICENLLINGEKVISSYTDKAFGILYDICEDPREKEESPACSPNAVDNNEKILQFKSGMKIICSTEKTFKSFYDICEDQISKEESPACSPHTGFKVDSNRYIYTINIPTEIAVDAHIDDDFLIKSFTWW